MLAVGDCLDLEGKEYGSLKLNFWFSNRFLFTSLSSYSSSIINSPSDCLVH